MITSEGPAIQVEVHLLPPLSTTAGREKVTLELTEGATLQAVVEALLKRFSEPSFRLHLYDTEGRPVPAWRVFINDRPAARLGDLKGLEVQVSDGDRVTFLLGLAGG